MGRALPEPAIERLIGLFVDGLEEPATHGCWQERSSERRNGTPYSRR
jgi:hypothetical protein